MNISTHLFPGLFVAALSLNSLPAFADADHVCRLDGSYGYLYNGTSYTPPPVPLTETGVFTVDKSGIFSGEGTLVFYFSDFDRKGNPLWLLLHEVQSGGVVTPDTNNPCTGTVNFVGTATVIKTSNSTLVLEGTVLFTDKPRSLAYTITGPNHETVEIISTSPGTIASGTAHKQGKQGKQGNDK